MNPTSKSSQSKEMDLSVLKEEIDKTLPKVFIAYYYGADEVRWKKILEEKLENASIKVEDCDASSADRVPCRIKEMIKNCGAIIIILTSKEHAVPAWLIFEMGIAFANDMSDKKLVALIDHDFEVLSGVKSTEFYTVRNNILRSIAGEYRFDKRDKDIERYDDILNPIVKELKSELLLKQDSYKGLIELRERLDKAIKECKNN